MSAFGESGNSVSARSNMLVRPSGVRRPGSVLRRWQPPSSTGAVAARRAPRQHEAPIVFALARGGPLGALGLRVLAVVEAVDELSVAARAARLWAFGEEELPSPHALRCRARARGSRAAGSQPAPIRRLAGRVPTGAPSVSLWAAARSGLSVGSDQSTCFSIRVRAVRLALGGFGQLARASARAP